MPIVLVGARQEIPVFQPFLQLAMAADGVGGDLPSGLGQFLGKFLVDTEDLRSFNAMGEKVTDDLPVNSWTGRRPSLAGRRAQSY